VAGQRAERRAADCGEPHRFAAFLIEYIISAAGGRVGDAESEPGSCHAANYRASQSAPAPAPFWHI